MLLEFVELGFEFDLGRINNADLLALFPVSVTSCVFMVKNLLPRSAAPTKM